MTTRIVGLASALALCSAFALGSSASADPVIVTGGTYNGLTGQFTLEGSGFSLTAADDFPINPCQPCSPSQSGPIDFNINLNEAPFSTGNPGTFNGVSYPATYLNGSLTFTAPTVPASALSGPSATITVPFSMTGSLIGFASQADETAYVNGGVTTNAFVNDLFSGSGTITATFTDPLGQGLFDSQSVMYQFGASSPSPTPEPASLLLLGTGVAGLVRRRVRRASNS